ncbi:MAG: hypothetical protein ACREYF_11920 [Gammaproteobacteria bacterium]
MDPPSDQGKLAIREGGQRHLGIVDPRRFAVGLDWLSPDLSVIAGAGQIEIGSIGGFRVCCATPSRRPPVYRP